MTMRVSGIRRSGRAIADKVNFKSTRRNKRPRRLRSTTCVRRAGAPLTSTFFLGTRMNEPVVGMLASRLATNREALCAWVAMNEPAVAEQLAREAFDAVTLDMQHGAVDFAGAMRSILSVALAGKPTIVRVPVGEFALASRLLDAGASAILAPMIKAANVMNQAIAMVETSLPRAPAGDGRLVHSDPRA